MRRRARRLPCGLRSPEKADADRVHGSGRGASGATRQSAGGRADPAGSGGCGAHPATRRCRRYRILPSATDDSFARARTGARVKPHGWGGSCGSSRGRRSRGRGSLTDPSGARAGRLQQAEGKAERLGNRRVRCRAPPRAGLARRRTLFCRARRMHGLAQDRPQQAATEGERTRPRAWVRGPWRPLSATRGGARLSRAADKGSRPSSRPLPIACEAGAGPRIRRELPPPSRNRSAGPGGTRDLRPASEES